MLVRAVAPALSIVLAKSATARALRSLWACAAPAAAAALSGVAGVAVAAGAALVPSMGLARSAAVLSAVGAGTAGASTVSVPCCRAARLRISAFTWARGASVSMCFPVMVSRRETAAPLRASRPASLPVISSPRRMASTAGARVAACCSVAPAAISCSVTVPAAPAAGAVPPGTAWALAGAVGPVGPWLPAVESPCSTAALISCFSSSSAALWPPAAAAPLPGRMFPGAVAAALALAKPVAYCCMAASMVSRAPFRLFTVLCCPAM